MRHEADRLAGKVPEYPGEWLDRDFRRLCDGYTAAWRRELHPRLMFTPEFQRWPNAFAAAECAAWHYAHAEDPSVFRAEKLQPIYLRKTQAEREREERLAAEQSK